MLSHQISGILPVNPSGGKIARAQAVSSLVEAGKVVPAAAGMAAVAQR
jgi:phage terminase large subunit-like protein